MKAFLALFLILVLVFETISAFPQLRYRRDAQKHDELSPEGEKKREELADYIGTEMVSVAKDTVNAHKDLFEKVLKQAEESDLKSDSIKEHLKKFSDLVEKINSLPAEFEDEDDVSKLFDIFADCVNLANGYDEIEEPTDEDKLMLRLLSENGASKVVFRFLMEFIKLRTNYEKHIQDFVDTLSDDDKAKETKFLEWFEKFKNAKDFENYVEITMEVFEYLGDEESEEKSE